MSAVSDPSVPTTIDLNMGGTYRYSGRLHDQDVAAGAVGDRVGDAPEHAAVHALVAHHDEVGSDLLRHRDDRLAGIGGQRVLAHVDGVRAEPGERPLGHEVGPGG